MRALISILLFAIFTTIASPSVASDAGWEVCSLVYLKGGADPVCNYRSFEQCQGAISGLGGTCIDNPYFRLKKQSDTRNVLSQKGRRVDRLNGTKGK